MSIELNTDQLHASYKFEHWYKHSTNQIFGIEGGAGTGKTTMILYCMDRLGIPLDCVLFTSYMGKAVSQMIRNGLPAKTIHSVCYNYEKEVKRDDNGKMLFNDRGKPILQWVQHVKEKLPKKYKLIVADEWYTIPERIVIDLLSFNTPIVYLGDSNQLPPPFGNPYMMEPDVILRQIMRQAEQDPIVYLAQQILSHEDLKEGVYGLSSVIKRSDLTDFQLRHADVIITTTNMLRGVINNLFREHFLSINDLSYPHYREKIICKRNNWGKFIKSNGEVYLTNGLTGFVDYVDKGSYLKNSIKIDFLPDFSNIPFRNLKVFMPHMNASPGTKLENTFIPPDCDLFEYAYALTTYACQGSQWDSVCVLQEDTYRYGSDIYWKSLYSAITRAAKQVIVAKPY